jgi:pyrroloquinoline quinone biosynthesis protein D
VTPRIPRGVRLHEDRVRGRWVLLAPERVIDLDPIGHAILTEIDGVRDVATISVTLAARYGAPDAQVAGDVRDYVTGLADRRLLEVAV